MYKVRTTIYKHKIIISKYFYYEMLILYRYVVDSLLILISTDTGNTMQGNHKFTLLTPSTELLAHVLDE